MVQIIDAPRPLSAVLGEKLAQGVSKNFPDPQQMVQRGMLSEAFQKLQAAEGEDYLTQLQSIAPALLTTSGGSEALGALAPILAQKARNKGIKGVIADKKRGLETRQPQNVGQTPGEISLGQGAINEQYQPESDVDTKQGQEIPVRPEDKFRKTRPEFSEETLYPQITSGPAIQKMLSPSELQMKALDYMDSSEDTGQPMSFESAMQLSQQENSNISEYNNQILKEQKLRDDKLKEMSAGVVSRAESAKMIDSPEDVTVIEKLAHKHRNEQTPANQWEKVRTDYKDWERAKNQLRRESSIPGPFGVIGRKLLGNYKDKETVMKNIQPALDEYRKYGLFDEARGELTGQLGMGPEDAETALFPFTKEQKNQLNIFPKNKVTRRPALASETEHRFPGAHYNMKDDDYLKFKDDLGGFLEKNPGINLISMRGRLNQDNRYSWNDISKGINELMTERRFIPDYIQNEQLPIINQSPLPGIGTILKEFWEGTK